MAAHPLPTEISVEEYLDKHIFAGEKPALEYVDGLLRPKPMPGDPHSAVQVNLTAFLKSQYGDSFKIRTELHIRTQETRFRVPDLTVLDRTRSFAGAFPGLKDPAYLCIEIKSPDDRLTQLFSKCDEYHDWGVPYCWVIDPETRRMWEYSASEAEPRPVLDQLSAGDLHIPAEAIFEDL